MESEDLLKRMFPLALPTKSNTPKKLHLFITSLYINKGWHLKRHNINSAAYCRTLTPGCD